MPRKTANIITLAVLLIIATGYYAVQYGKSKPDAAPQQIAVSQANPVKTNQGGVAGRQSGQMQVPSGDASSLGEHNDSDSTTAVEEYESPGDMKWFYKRFGYSTWFDESVMNIKTFTTDEYDKLIKAALTGNESATAALRLTIFKYLKENPNDKEYEALKSKVYSQDFLLNVPRLEYLVDSVPAVFMDNKDFSTALLKKNGSFLKFLSERLRGDKEIVFEAVSQGSSLLGFATDSIRGDREFAVKLLEKDPSTLCYISDELRSDKTLVKKAISEDISHHGDRRKRLTGILRCMSSNLLNDKDFVTGLIKDHDLRLLSGDDSLGNNKIVVLAALKNHPEDYSEAAEHIQNDPEVLQIIKAYIMGTSATIRSLPEKLRADRDVMKKVVVFNCRMLEIASPEVKDDEEIIRIAMESSPDCLSYASDRIRNKINPR